MDVVVVSMGEKEVGRLEWASWAEVVAVVDEEETKAVDVEWWAPIGVSEISLAPGSDEIVDPMTTDSRVVLVSAAGDDSVVVVVVVARPVSIGLS